MNLTTGAVSILSLGILVCFVYTLVVMFQSGRTLLGIVSLVLVIFCGIGGLIAFIWGWMNHRLNPNLRTVMIVWTILLVLALITTGHGFLTGGVQLPW